MPRITRPPVPHVIDGEDRSLGGSALYVDLVPSTCWGSAGRTVLATQYEWVRIRRMVYERAGDACEICGNTRESLAAAGVAPRLHAHERYSYKKVRGRRIQRLERLVCLCILCDEVTHIGRASLAGEQYFLRAKEHAKAINGWSNREFDKHLKAATKLWAQRSKYEWELDVTVLRNAGARLLPVPCA
ncbi:DNA primase [Streptomyces sp. NPDC002889]|uniref:DNA primase n=1 Tax=Streptomyces sp. NPDC002889 TaxID=3364669 RepID=UPI0036B24C95